MVKAKINKEIKLLDETSNYIYSIIDINPDEDNLNYKKCYWTHNQNGHTNIDYNADNIGSFFTTDIWNIQFVLGVEPSIGDKFLVKYNLNKGIVRVDEIRNTGYAHFGVEPTTARIRWLNWEKIKEFPIIKNQNNVYVENQYEENLDSNNICISKYTDNTSPSQFSASCFNVENRKNCLANPTDSIENIENSVERLYLENKNCEDYMFKNYALIKASVSDPENNIITGGNKMQKGGNIWLTEDSLKNDRNNEKWYFYLEPKINDKNIFTNIHNVVYYPAFNPPIETNEKIKYDNEIKNWSWNDTSSRNIILNRLLNDFKYDGYIEKRNKDNSGIIRGIILPKHFVLFYKNIAPIKTAQDGYIFGDFKSYNISYKNIYVVEREKYLSSDVYSNYYIKIKTKIGDKIQTLDKIDDMIYKLNKCKELTENRLCIPYGNISKTASNIKNTDYLTQITNVLDKPSSLSIYKNETEQLSTNHPFRIINIYGKYLCDIFVNDSQFCEYDSSKFASIGSSEILFQRPMESINLIRNQTQYIHNMSFESLWTFEKNNNNSYKLINTYTGKYLTKNLLNSANSSDEPAELYIEFADSKYFKQQISNKIKQQTHICYANEDIYYIYYRANGKKLYLSTEDVLINNKYNNSSKVIFNSSPTQTQIIKPATRNLDQITDETEDLPEFITNVCYNQTKICSKNVSNIALFENNNLQCLNISYLFRKKNNEEFIEQNLNEFNVLNLINKTNDNFLSVPHKGYYDLMFYFPDIKINKIKFKFSGLFNPINSYNDTSKNSEVRLININKWLEDNKSFKDFSFEYIDNLAIDDETYKKVLSVKLVESLNEKKYFEVENSQISKEQEININVLDNDNITNSIIQFRIYCEEGFTLNYVEAYGKTLGALKFRTEKKTVNNKSKISQNLNIDKSLITSIENLKLNTVKIKYLTRVVELKENNLNNRANNIYIKNNSPIIDSLNSTNFILFFNPLLNAYMFYINNNKFLSIDNVSYFKLIHDKNNTAILNNNTNITYHLQSLHNSNLYVNINNSNNLVLGTTPQLFQLFKIDEPIVYQNIININNSFLNNILYNLDNRIIYMQVKFVPFM
jgi:hypothetical protein